MMRKIGFSDSSSLIRGTGWFYFLSYSVQDCSLTAIVTGGYSLFSFEGKRAIADLVAGTQLFSSNNTVRLRTFKRSSQLGQGAKLETAYWLVLQNYPVQDDHYG